MHHWLTQYFLIIDIYLYISLKRSRLHLTSAMLCTRYKDTTINDSCTCSFVHKLGVNMLESLTQ
jgi:hypothetical protein